MANGGGPMSIREVQAWIQTHHAGRWKDISTQLADLTIGGNTSSSYRENEKFLERVSRGVYRLAPAFSQRQSQPESVQPKAQCRSKAVVASQTASSRRIGNSSDEPSIFVPGLPATFATSMERTWKATLDRTIPQAPPDHAASGLRMTFSVEALERWGQPYDLDNLCEPVVSVLVNKKGYFGRRRPNIRWWYARRLLKEPTGCAIELSQAGPPTLEGVTLVFQSEFSGLLPRSARETAIAEGLITSSAPRPSTYSARFAVALLFNTMRINLGEIATGSVKAVIDNLFPILGGAIGAPQDWRIDELLVAKQDAEIADPILEIQIHALTD